MRTNQIGLQLYTLRAETHHDLLGVLKQVRKIGYPAVEFAGLMGVEPMLVRATLDALEMEAAAAHIPLEHWEAQLPTVLDELITLGCPYAVVPWLSPEKRGSLEITKRLVETLNTCGKACRERGIGLMWHHHDFEFEEMPGAGGRTMMDILIAETDPETVGFEADLFWAAVGGQDPAAFLERLAGRVHAVHMKDVGTTITEQGIPLDVPAVSGTLDWPLLIANAEAAGAVWFIAEQDNPNPADPVGDVTSAWTYLSGLAE
ncbi:MAG: sugar phosphate isomerase/epimerase family protein [Chloroflexota bacterium]